MVEKTIVDKAGETVGIGIEMTSDVAGAIKTAVGAAVTSVGEVLKKEAVEKSAKKTVTKKAILKSPAKKAGKRTAVKKTPAKKAAKKTAKKTTPKKAAKKSVKKAPKQLGRRRQ
jgi:hypothetical protein